MERNFGTRLLRTIFMGLDNVIYHLIAYIMQAIFDIADLPADTFEVIFNDIISRIYLILAIFMMFKVIISLLSYLVNPDTIGDKQQGASKLITKIMLVLIMLLFQPTFFQLLFSAQAPLLRTIPRVILGGSTYTEQANNTWANNTTEGITDSGIDIAWSVLKTFYSKNPTCYGGNDSDYIEIEGFSGNSDILNNATLHINDSCSAKDDSSMYAYDYKWFISSLAGGFLCYCLIGIAITIGVRMFKLIILQAIAPIPIISYMDPKANKDGAFNQWIKTLFKTWLELFINLAIVYLIIHLVTLLISKEGSAGIITYVQGLGGRRGTFFLLFVILGLFAFARQAPKFILDILGIKNGGSFGKVLGLSAAAVRMPSTMINEGREAYTHSIASGNSKFESALRGISGGLLRGFGTTGMAMDAGYGADKNSRAAVLSNLDRRQQDLLNRDSRDAKVMKEYEDYIADRVQKKGADIAVGGITDRNGNAAIITLNEFDIARQAAMANGNKTFTVGNNEFDTYGSSVEDTRSKIIDAAGEMWADNNINTDARGNAIKGPDNNERQAVIDYRNSIRQTGGRTRSRRILPGGQIYNPATYRGRRKPTERHVTVANNTRQNRQSK